ncbi:MAG: single-stranded DNA-binding protein [Solirubrobacterales bacterium]
MQDMNTVTVTGRIAQDPELRHTNGGTAVAKLRVAIQRPNGKEAEDRGAAFYDVDAWRGTAIAAANHLSVGSKVAIEGYLEQDEWESEGSKRYRNYIVARRIHFLDPRSTEEGEEARDPEGPREEDPLETAASPAGGEEEIPF